MLTVDEARRLVDERSAPLAPIAAPLAACLGRVLAEDVQSDVDSPPFDKSIVDGYAVVAADLRDGAATLAVIEEIVAGQVPSRGVRSGEATRIMTGAPLPAGATAVVMVERSEAVPAIDGQPKRVALHEPAIREGLNILPRAASLRRGEIVLRSGTRLRPTEIGLLAELGRGEVRTIPPPSVAVLPTGDELVEHTRAPAAGQIRNSNGPLLAACVAQTGAECRLLPIARDEAEHLRSLVRRGLEADVLVLSGGVSAGVLDLVPEVLAELGVERVFHKVRLKPGKPLWFGVLARSDRSTLVFGLPGNPVSSFVCFQLFVRPAIDRLSGGAGGGLRRLPAKLVRPFAHRGDRPTYHPALVTFAGSAATAEPLAWQGSADLRGLVNATGLVCFPAGDRAYAIGDELEVLLLD